MHLIQLLLRFFHGEAELLLFVTQPFLCMHDFDSLMRSFSMDTLAQVSVKHAMKNKQSTGQDMGWAPIKEGYNREERINGWKKKTHN